MQIRRPMRWLPHADRRFAAAGALIGGTLLVSALIVGPVLAVHDLPFFQLDRDYQVTGYPETFVIARDGTIRKKWIGPADWSSAANLALIRDLLSQ